MSEEYKGAWWCKTHQREAIAINPRGDHVCSPQRVDIMLPCDIMFCPPLRKKVDLQPIIDMMRRKQAEKKKLAEDIASDANKAWIAS